MLSLALGRRGGRSGRRGRRKALLRRAGRSLLDADGWRLELERGGWPGGRARRCILRCRRLGLALLCCGVRVYRNAVGRLGRVACEAGEAWGVGSGLQTQLGEVQIRSGLVTSVHGLHQAALSPEAVGDDAVNEEHENFDDDFDDGTDEAPVL